MNFNVDAPPVTNLAVPDTTLLLIMPKMGKEAECEWGLCYLNIVQLPETVQEVRVA